MQKVKKNTIQGDMASLIPIEKIENGNIFLKNNKKVSVFKFEPTNFKLKTLMEQESILEGYKLFLKRCNFDMQLIVQTQKRDLAEYIMMLKGKLIGNDEVREMLNDYIGFLKEAVESKNIVSKNLYILVEINSLNEEDVFMKISESLRACDNEVKKCTNQEVVNIIKRYLNKEIVQKGNTDELYC